MKRRTRRPFPGATQRFDATLDEDGKIRVGVWDRFTSWGEKIKQGRKSVFNEKTLGQMVSNWQARGDLLAMCLDHESAAAPFVRAPAAAFYSSLAVVRRGKVLQLVATDHAIVPAAADPMPDASTRADGLYGFRCEVTPLGEHPTEGLRCYRYISPMFDDEGDDEQGREIGYVLYDVAATNTPFQAGCEITFGALGAQRMNLMDPKLLQKLGLADGASDDEIQTAIKAYGDSAAAKLAELEGTDASQMAQDLEDLAKYAAAGEAERLRKLATRYRMLAGAMPTGAMPTGAGPTGAGATDKEAQEDREAMQRLIDHLDLKLPANATTRQIAAAVEGRAVSLDRLAIVEKELVALKKARELERGHAHKSKARQFVEAAVRLGRTTEEKSDAVAAAYLRGAESAVKAGVVGEVELEQAAQKEAEGLLFAAGTFPSRAVALTRLTQGGAPIGATVGQTPQMRAGTPSAFNVGLAEEAKKMVEQAKKDPTIMAKLTPIAGPNPTPGMLLYAAQQVVRRDRPDLVEDEAA
jgi:hypothetical protein